MKISQKQANLLAKEVAHKLKKNNVGEVPEFMVQKIREFKEKQNQLKSVVDRADQALDRHEAKFNDLVGNIRGLYASDSPARIIQKIKEGDLPNVSEIEDKIILKSMFANDTDMETFIAAIVKKFTKKKPSVVNN